jgi:hypothetical protein
MYVQLPKPLHGWRQFAGEVGIIVLGVLIALGARRLQNVQQRSTNEARRAVRGELEVNMSRLASRAAQKHCVENRMEEIQALLDSGQQSVDHDAGLGRKAPILVDADRPLGCHRPERRAALRLPTTLPIMGRSTVG